jgi:hypothetical protein
VAEIESTGQAEVGRIYKQFREHEDLRIFLDKLRAIEDIIQNRAEIFMDTGFVPTDLFDESKRMELVPSESEPQVSQAADPTSDK